MPANSSVAKKAKGSSRSSENKRQEPLLKIDELTDDINDILSIESYLAVIEKWASKRHKSVIKLLSQEDNQGRTIAYRIAAGKDEALNNRLLLVLDTLADYHPKAVWTLLLRQHEGVKLGVYLIKEHKESNIYALLNVLNKLFRTVNVLDDFEIIKSEVNFGKDHVPMNDWGKNWTERYQHSELSIIRSVFQNVLATTKSTEIRSQLEFLSKAAEIDKGKTQFLLEHDQTTLKSLSFSVVFVDDAVCLYKYAHLLDVMGDADATQAFISGYTHKKTAATITKYVLSEPFNSEKETIARDALQHGTTLNKIFDIGYSARERQNCCFPLFRRPQEYHLQLTQLLERNQAQSTATPQ